MLITITSVNGKKLSDPTLSFEDLSRYLIEHMFFLMLERAGRVGLVNGIDDWIDAMQEWTVARLELRGVRLDGDVARAVVQPLRMQIQQAFFDKLTNGGVQEWHRVSEDQQRKLSKLLVARLRAELPASRREEVQAFVIKAIARQLHVDEAQVATDKSLEEDLGVDSLDVVDLVVKIENEYGLEISDPDLRKANPRLVSQVVDFVMEQIEASAARRAVPV